MFPLPIRIVGHIVGERPPTLFSWVLAALFGMGAIGAIITKGWVRRIGVGLAFVGIAASAWDAHERSIRPPRPDLTIRLVLPGLSSPMPLAIEVCGSTNRNRLVEPTGNGRLLLVKLDGIQVAEVHVSRLAIRAAPGIHTLSVEINSPDHQEYAPALILQRIVHVEDHTGSISFLPCRNR